MCETSEWISPPSHSNLKWIIVCFVSKKCHFECVIHQRGSVSIYCTKIQTFLLKSLQTIKFSCFYIYVYLCLNLYDVFRLNLFQILGTIILFILFRKIRFKLFWAVQRWKTGMYASCLQTLKITLLRKWG